MDKGTEALRAKIISVFPKLASDDNFDITSPQTPDYNCLAWACNYSDRWMQPPAITEPPFDSVVYWPPEAKQGLGIDCLIDAFKSKGYEVCESWEHEAGYQKVALYVKDGTTGWTHAAREKRNGFWTSKLGSGNDIQHGTPFTIEGKSYGVVYCIMKRVFL
jgi:hypothetical protein